MESNDDEGGVNAAYYHSLSGGDDNIFTNTCNYKKIRLIDDKGAKNCYLLQGIIQSNKSFVTAVEKALDIPYGTLLDHCIKELEKHQAKFNTLERGKIKGNFSTLDIYVDYLKNKSSLVDENNSDDLITLFNPKYPRKLNIIIFNDKSEVKAKDHVVMINKRDPVFLLRLLENSKYKTVIIIRNKTNYYPMVHSGKMLFSHDDYAILILKGIIEATMSMEGLTRGISLKKELKLNDFIH